MQFYLKGLQEVMIEGTGWDTQQPLADCQADLDAWVVDLKKAEVRSITVDSRYRKSGAAIACRQHHLPWIPVACWQINLSLTIRSWYDDHQTGDK